MSRISASVNCNEEQIKALESIISDPRYHSRYIVRARIILKLNTGMQLKDVAEELGVDPRMVGRWRDRFLESGVNGLMVGSGYDKTERKSSVSVKKDARKQAETGSATEPEASVSNNVSVPGENGRPDSAHETEQKAARGSGDDDVIVLTVPEGVFISRTAAVVVMSSCAVRNQSVQKISGSETISELLAGSRKRADANYGVKSLLDTLFNDEKLNEAYQKSEGNAAEQAFLQKIAKKCASESDKDYRAVVFSRDNSDQMKYAGLGMAVDEVQALEEFLPRIKRDFDLPWRQGSTPVSGWKVRDKIHKLIDSAWADGISFTWLRAPLETDASFALIGLYSDKDGNTFVVSEETADGFKKVSDINMTNLDGFHNDFGDAEKAFMDVGNRVISNGLERFVDTATDKAVKKKKA